MSGARRHFWVEILFVILVTLLALAVRVYRLPEAPPGLWLDEAANGLDVLDVLDGHYPIFFERNNGREPLFLYLQALIVSLAGATPFALRLAAALVGAATVPATYVLVRTLFSGSGLPAGGLAAWSALFLAFSYWHISLSRLGLRAITLPLMATLAFIFFWRAWPRLVKGGPFPWADLLWCGVLVGLSLYTYTASRFIPLVLVLTMTAGVLLPKANAPGRRSALSALAVIALTSLAVFAPLAAYFIGHPDEFMSRATSVSIFSKQFASDGPLLALGESVLKTVAMFVTLPDPNPRHNPALRPVFEPLLAAWLAAGIAVALARWRRLPYLFCLLWFGLLALPALLTAQGLPHSLRSIGMLPAAVILPVLAMLSVGRRLAVRWRGLALWLPLPFLLFSSATGLYDYFSAWRSPERFRDAFLTDYARVGASIASDDDPSTVWLLPLSPNYYLPDGQMPSMTVIDFFVRDRTNYGVITVDPKEAPFQLAQLTNGRQYVHLLRIPDATVLFRDSFVYNDVKQLLDFLLRKQGRLVSEQDESAIGAPYSIYEVPPAADYPIHYYPRPFDILFDGKLRLVAADYGRTALRLNEDADALGEQRTPAGESLWATLRWEAATPIDFDLKASLLLRDDAGHLAGQIDKLLVSDHYPALRVWSAGEEANTYHILEIAPAIAPGRYHLYVKVYEDKTGRIYAARDASGTAIGVEVPLGAFEVTPTQTFPTLTPGQPLAATPQLAPNLTLTGIDLPRTTLAPGETLPVTFYWHAWQKPAADYTVHLQLITGDGTVIAEQQNQPGGNRYPTTQWRTGETLRDWMDLPLAPTTPSGSYELVVSLTAGGVETGRFLLGPIEVDGRIRHFEPPPLSQSVTASFGQQVRLLGIDSPAEMMVAPGAELSLTLAWQAQAEPAAPLVRFVHLLGAEGRPLAQQDSVPCGGECPATSWMASEILLDQVTLTLPPDLPTGTYRLVTGWYDPATVTRLEARDEQGNRLAEDVVELPVRVVVRERIGNE